MTEKKYRETGKALFHVEIPISQDDLENILVSAFEGGSNYWLDRVELVPGGPENCQYASDYCAAGGTLKLTPDDYEHDGQPYVELTREKLLAGIKTYLTNGKHTVNVGMDDLGYCLQDTDATDADTILQYAVFGELVFC